MLRLARRAVDQEAQGRGVGTLLLRAVFQIARDMAGSVGCGGDAGSEAGQGDLRTP
ncbi:MAG: GNAT family N-acetyltransferase [Deltaproteobacteria bacterium]|nr:GNAT family N-acetyltransferase [Deltaproteobacteria bacterium]MBW2537006.1 GNAT family N-acetyltransferase [Deltaproteobacteria bacterium]